MTVELKYLPLHSIILWQDNAKLHEIGAIIQSIERFGFRDFPEWDDAINGGKGGIVAGNGRVEALIKMWADDDTYPEPPLYIVEALYNVGSRKEWLIPVIVGFRSKTEEEATAYGIDNNNLVMLGGDVDLTDVMKMWDMGKYLSLLGDIDGADADFPISVDEDDFAEMKRMLSGSNPSLFEDDEDSNNDDGGNNDSDSSDNESDEVDTERLVCPHCGKTFHIEKR